MLLMSTKLYIKNNEGKYREPTKNTGEWLSVADSDDPYTARMLAGAWLAATALMKFGPKFLWNQVLAFTLLAIGLDVVVGVGMILANKKYVAELDELQQKVYLNALGMTVGVALIAGVPYAVMDF